MCRNWIIELISFLYFFLYSGMKMVPESAYWCATWGGVSELIYH